MTPTAPPSPVRNAIAYYRLSTDQQEESGLGLEAQQFAVNHFANREGYTIANAYTEIESGKKDNRPQLLAALAQCKKQRATLIIAKLDRLGRKVSLIANLIDSKVDFRVVDNPHANKPTLQMLAVFAEHERDLISQRTKEGLAAAKRKGTILGQHGRDVLSKRNAAAAIQFARNMRPTVERIQAAGFISIRSICAELNRQQVPTFRTGKKWCRCSVHHLLKRLNKPLD